MLYKHEAQNTLIKEEQDNIPHIKNKKANKEKIYGLAFSGGGIRSASFGLGVLQALAKYDCLKKFDYLSTVSGGGYIGSSLSWFLHKHWQKDGSRERVEFGVSKANFPFGTRPNALGDDEKLRAKKTALSDEEKTTLTALKGGSKDKMSILRYIRQNMNYLFPSDSIGPFSLLASIVRGFVLNLLVYGALFMAVLLGVSWVIDAVMPSLTTDTNGWVYYLKDYFGSALTYTQHQATGNLTLLIPLAIAVYALSITFSLGYSVICSFWKKVPDRLYALHRGYLSASTTLTRLALFCLLLGSLPIARQFIESITDGHHIEAGAMTLILSAISGIASFYKANSLQSKTLTNILIGVISFLLVYSFLFVVYLSMEALLQSSLGDPFTLSLLLAGIIGLGWLIQINYITLHGYYRDRLMELFLPSYNDAVKNKPNAPANEANTKALSEICNYNEEATGPYHLINSNVILTGSKITKFKGRGGDNFILSPQFCGSSATGWTETTAFNKNTMTLSSAMAISGAAANPNAGPGGQGFTRNYFLSLVMSILNLRLGVWVLNPLATGYRYRLRPDMLYPGLRDALLAKKMDEEARYVQLSDGGHFENLAVYELVRRKVDVIVLSDAAADDAFSFADFSNFVEKIRLDFGARVDIDLDALIPVPNSKPQYGLDKVAESGYVVGKITYHDNTEATLIYIKSTITQELPADIYGFKLQNPTFPDQSTADQFFDEKQFEAYRELGYQLCKKMLFTTNHHSTHLYGEKISESLF